MNNEIDLAVHSMKDVPMQIPTKLKISTITERESPLDALISKNNIKLSDLPKNAIIGTSSLRRSSQLLKYRPDFQIKTLRGNIDTRINKLDNNHYEYDEVEIKSFRRWFFWRIYFFISIIRNRSV